MKARFWRFTRRRFRPSANTYLSSSLTFSKVDMARAKSLDANEVWKRVHQFAQNAKDQQLPVYTLGEKPRRIFITNVTESTIERRSDRGSTQTTPITRGMILKFWTTLETHGRAQPGDLPYFVLPLLLAALPRH